jgi:signal transduction histidine kinase
VVRKRLRGPRGKENGSQKAGPGQIAAKKPARKLPAKRPAKRPETESGIVEAALAAFAHEVRTPLTGILAISSLLATSELGEREKRWVDTIKVGAEHLAALATLFVDGAQRQHRAVRASGFLRSAHPVANAGRPLAGRASAKGLQSQVTIAEGLPAFVIGDPVRLRAALENLIDNAVKFTQQGDVALDVSVKAGAAANSMLCSRCPTAASACRLRRSGGCSNRSRKPM